MQGRTERIRLWLALKLPKNAAWKKSGRWYDTMLNQAAGLGHVKRGLVPRREQETSVRRGEQSGRNRASSSRMGFGSVPRLIVKREDQLKESHHLKAAPRPDEEEQQLHHCTTSTGPRHAPYRSGQATKDGLTKSGSDVY